ncbi:MAG TPA: NHL repeat-containing protein [bacterium]|nr:NHL repeat-containing protein [bacterium]
MKRRSPFFGAILLSLILPAIGHNQTATPTFTPDPCQGISRPFTGLQEPVGVFLDNSNGILYVVDRFQKLCLFQSADGTPVTSISSWTGGSFSLPHDVVLDSLGDIFVVDNGNSGVNAQIDEFDPNLNFIRTIGAGVLSYPRGIWVDDQGTTQSLFITTHYDGVYRYDSVSGGSFSAVATFGGAILNVPTGITKVGNRIYVADDGGRIMGFDLPNYIPTTLYTGIGDLKSVRADASGRFYVTEANASLLDIFPSGFGTAPQQCHLSTPWGIALNSNGNIFVTETNDQAVTVLSGFGAPPTPTPNPGGLSFLVPGGCFIYPSPIRGPQAKLAYFMAESGSMDLKIFNESGELAADVTDQKPAGPQTTPFRSSALAPGVYFYSVTLSYGSGKSERLKSGKFIVVR